MKGVVIEAIHDRKCDLYDKGMQNGPHVPPPSGVRAGCALGAPKVSTIAAIYSKVQHSKPCRNSTRIVFHRPAKIVNIAMLFGLA